MTRDDTWRCETHLRIISTTDLHHHILPYDYLTDSPAPGRGLACAATLIDSLRRSSDTALLFDNGDFLEGNPLYDTMKAGGHEIGGGVHPVIAAMNALDYDAATLGNHEFNYGLDCVDEAISAARFPIVLANVERRDGRSLLPPFVVMEREVSSSNGTHAPLRIGVIGFAPPQIMLWDRLILDGSIVTQDIVATAKQHLPDMLDAGVDVVIALCHAGISVSDHVPGLENAALALAALDGIDIVIAGHTHRLFPPVNGAVTGDLSHPAIDTAKGTLHGKPAVMAGAHGSHVGVIDLVLTRDAGRWTIKAHESRAMPVAADTLPAPAICAAVETVHAGLLDLMRVPIGQTGIALQSYFALVAPDPSLQVVADAQRVAAVLALQGHAIAELPILSAVAPYRSGGRDDVTDYIDIPAGPLALRHVGALTKFPNLLCAIALSGADLRDWLEKSASMFRQITPGTQGQSLIVPAFPGYDFDVIHGISYEIDLARAPRFAADGALLDPKARRISAMTWQGAEIAEGDRFVVVTNSYRAAGVARHTCGELVLSGPLLTRDAVRDYIIAEDALNPTPAPTWRFAPMPGTRVSFCSAPAALSHLASVRERLITDAGPGACGFHRFDLHL